MFFNKLFLLKNKGTSIVKNAIDAQESEDIATDGKTIVKKISERQFYDKEFLIITQNQRYSIIRDFIRKESSLNILNLLNNRTASSEANFILSLDERDKIYYD